MKSSTRPTVPCVVVLLSLVTTAFAQQHLPGLDRRPAANAPIRPAEAQRSAEARLRTQSGSVQVDFDPITAAPKYISPGGAGFLTGPGGAGVTVSSAIAAGFTGAPHAATRAFIQEHRDLFGHGPEALDRARIRQDILNARSGLHTVVWQQQVHEIPVFDGQLISHTTARGELVSLCSQFLPDPDAAAGRGSAGAAATISAIAIKAGKAVAIAGQDTGDDTQETELTLANQDGVGAGSTGPDQHQRFSARSLKGDADVQLVWLPMSRDELRLCWKVELTSRVREEMYRFLIDSQTGNILVRQCLTADLSDATYNIFTGGSPAPMVPSLSYPATTQAPIVSPQLVTLSAVDTNASPDGWIDDGVNETRGNNVDAHSDWNGDDIPDLPRPQGSPFRVFNFPIDLTQDPHVYVSGAIVSLFYWCNFMHDKLYDLGFTEQAGNFQVTNFNRGGVGNDAVQADAQDGAMQNNANFSTGADGSTGRLQIFLWTGPTPARDPDLEAHVILHEYTHGLSMRLVGHGAGISQVQAGSMGEGWSDFYAQSMIASPTADVDAAYCMGPYVSYLECGITENYYFGHRRYPYSTDMSKSPLTLKDIDELAAGSHPGVPISPNPCISPSPGEVHNAGEVWCVTLWDARANLIKKYGWTIGNQLILRLVTDAMNLCPANPTFLQSRDAILSADLVDNGGANLQDLWKAFAKRGMGYSAVVPPNNNAPVIVGVIEAFDLPPALVSIPTNVTEGNGILRGAGQVRLPYSFSADQIVNLTSSLPSRLVVPSSVTIPAGQTATNFDVTVIDDALLNGTQTATVTATTSNLPSSQATCLVYDNETATLQVSLPASVTEGQGTVLGTVQISSPPAVDIAVNLGSSDATEIQVPATVTIPAGQTSATFTATVKTDTVFDGTETVTITAHVQNWVDGTASVSVLDDLSVHLLLPAAVWENAGTLPASASVRISGTLAYDLFVSLSSSDPSRLSVPSSVTIPAGQSSAPVPLTLIDNMVQDGNETVTIQASAWGFVAGSGATVVLDDDSPPAPSNPSPADSASNVPSAITSLGWAVVVTNDLIQNGGFETGTFTNWTLAPSIIGQFAINDGTFDSPSPDGVNPPFSGHYDAVMYEIKDGVHGLFVTNSSQFVLYQQVTIPASATYSTLSYNFRVANYKQDNQYYQLQEFRVQLFDTNNNVLTTLFHTVNQPGGPGTPWDPYNVWTNLSHDLSAYAGQTLRIAFVVQADDAFMDVHLDNISLQTASFGGAVTSDVYFGTNSTPGPAQYLGTTSGLTWPLPVLDPATHYYWQIVSHHNGTAAGPVWSFTTRGVDHFDIGSVASPQAGWVPFTVTIAARDELNRIVPAYTGQVQLNASAVTTSNLLGGVSSTGSSTTPGTTYGYSFTPTTNLTVTHVRSYFGSKVSIWTDTGGLVVSQPVTSTPGTWAETPLANPVQLMAGHTYRVGAYTASSFYRRFTLVTNTPFGTIIKRYSSTGDQFPTGSLNLWPLVDLRFNVAYPASIGLTPPQSGNFINGTWTGSVTIQQGASGIVLTANDGNGHFGASNPFDVTPPLPPSITVQPVSQTVTVGDPVTFSVTAVGTQPLYYQWYLGGNSIAGATNSTLAIANVQTTNAGSYYVLVYNMVGINTSATATLTVQVPPYTVISGGQTNLTFRGDTTYYISGGVNLYGTTKFEGGAVIKYAQNAALVVSWPDSVVCTAYSYRPVIFTAKDDDSVGLTISGSTGTPSGNYGNPAFRYIGSGSTGSGFAMSNFRIAYANLALMAEGVSVGVSLSDGVLLNCSTGFSTPGQAGVSLRNMLFTRVQTAFILGIANVNAQNVTFDGIPMGPPSYIPSFIVMPYGANLNSAFGSFVNCIFDNIAAYCPAKPSLMTGHNNGFYNNSGTPFGTSNVVTSVNPYQSAGAGNFYLANSNAFRNAGSTAIDASLLTDLTNRTTYPPIVCSNVVVTADTVLGPVVPSDTDTPDLGFHYDPIDYLLCRFTVTNNAGLFLTNGVAIATYNDTGIWLQQGTRLTSIGTPLNPNWIVRYSSVQEQPIFLGLGPSSGLSVNPYHTAGSGPTALYRFTDFASPSKGGFHLYDYSSWGYSQLTVRDCEFWGAGSTFGGSSNSVAVLRNNLFNRSAISFFDPQSPSSLSLSNNLVYGTSSRVMLIQPAGAQWNAFNNVFDSCTISTLSTCANNNNNAYLNCTNRINPPGAADIVLPTSLAWQTGPLGSFYQPASSPLIDTGSCTADLAGLAHYTTQISQTPELSTIVDLGYHYVALDANGNPLDLNGDGIPDYLTDP